MFAKSLRWHFLKWCAFLYLGNLCGVFIVLLPPHIKKHQQLSKTDLKNVWKVFPEGKGTDTAAVVAAIWQQTAM